MVDKMLYKLRKTIITLLICGLIIINISACSNSTSDDFLVKEDETSADVVIDEQQEIKIPKYVFLFIGDGMGYSQIQTTAYSLDKKEKLPFMNFPQVGMMTTYNSDSTITDSASAATAMATGHKTSSGTLGMNAKRTKSYATIAEYIKKELGYKIGIITSVSLNHATPAGFYAHETSRNNFYQIGMDLVESNFDLFVGGGFYQSQGVNRESRSLYALAREEGYDIYREQEKIDSLKNGDTKKTIIISKNKIDNEYMKYDMDLEKGEYALSDYVSKGIELLDNDKGFFMMVEGGKIDLANHSNDAATMINETLAFSEAVNEAIDFYKKHKDETLIIVTADHESGGLSIGYSQTTYSTYLERLEKQKMSFYRFNTEYVSRYKKDRTSFEEVVEDIGKIYGNDFSEKEIEEIRKAYIRTIRVGPMTRKDMTEEEYEKYGVYEPLTITISHIMNHKAGLDYTTYSHTGVPVPVYSLGFGSENFAGSYDNTDIFKKLYKLLDL